VCPTHLLFNGGVMKAGRCARGSSTSNGWLTGKASPARPAHVLDAPISTMRSRVAPRTTAGRAADAGFASGLAQLLHRIESGCRRYRGCRTAESPRVVPFGMEEGTSAPIAGREFGLSVGEPAEFRFLVGDPQSRSAGDHHRRLGRCSKISPLGNPGGARPACPTRTVPVTLESRVTEIGTFELWCNADITAGN
jgi:hypothetical protein